MLSTIIVEDEVKSASMLLAWIKAHDELAYCGTANNIETALELTEREKPHLIFMDINLYGSSAFDLLIFLEPNNSDIVFLTAYSKIDLRAIHFSGFNVMFKPLDPGEFNHIIQDILSIERRSTQQRIELLRGWLNKEKELSIAIRQNAHFEFIDIRDIKRCEASGVKTKFVLDGDYTIYSNSPIIHYKRMLKGQKGFKNRRITFIQSKE